MLKKVDYVNKKAVKSELKEFEKSTIKESIETACVITKGGEVYTYEFTRNANDIDEQLEEWFVEENYQHCIMIEQAKKYGIGYRRWKNE